MDADIPTELHALFRTNPVDADRIALALIKSLELENARQRRARLGSLSEADLEYRPPDRRRRRAPRSARAS